MPPYDAPEEPPRAPSRSEPRFSEPSYSSRDPYRTAEEPQDRRQDSRLDPHRPIADQFDLLRVADPDRFPAFFDLRGHRYLVRIEKAGAADE